VTHAPSWIGLAFRSPQHKAHEYPGGDQAEANHVALALVQLRQVQWHSQRRP
jgi:hypothetical protein